MRSTLRHTGFVLSCFFLALLGACGGGGSSSPSGNLTSNTAPRATSPTVSPADSPLAEYKIYTFSTVATDPDIGDSVASCTWDFGDGTAPVTVTTSPFSVQHAFGSASAASTVTVTPKDSHGLQGAAASSSFVVAQASNPFTVAVVSPKDPVTQAVQVGTNVSYTFDFTVDLDSTSGLAYAASGITFTTNDTLADTVGVATLKVGTTNEWLVTVAFPAAAVAGSRTFTPSVSVTDTTGVMQSLVVSLPAMTITTSLSVALPPVVTLGSVATIPVPGVANSTWQGVPIAFTATAVDPQGAALTYSWTFGDAGGLGDTPSSTQLTQTHTYDAAGVYIVTFTATNGIPGGTKSISLVMNILANQPPALAYSQTPNGNPYAFAPITFAAAVTDPNADSPTITWNFGDGSAAVTGASVTHTWTALGVTNASVSADDGKGGVITVDIPLTILANLPPTTTVTTAGASLYQKKEYTFTASATDPDSGDTISSFVWNFGDGTTSTSVPDGGTSGQTRTTSVKHTYLSSVAPGTLAVTAQALDSHLAPGAMSPAASFTLVSTSLPVGSFVSPASAVSYNTELGAAGVVATYIVGVTNPNGASGAFLPVANVTLDPGDAQGTVLTSVGNGDGTYTFQVRYAPASAVGTRQVTPTVVATDLQGISSNLTAGPAVSVVTQAKNNPPQVTLVSVPLISAGTNATWQHDAVTFNGTATDQDGDAMVYTWDFGDGTIGMVTPVPAGGAISATHTYTNASPAGGYAAKLTVSDGRTLGQVVSSLSMNIIANSAPVLSVGAVASPYSLVPTAFTATATDADSDPIAITWDFGDATGPVTGLSVSHTYKVVGPVQIKTTADDGKGGVTVVTTPITVLTNHAPVATVTTTAASLYQSRTYTFTATATDSDAADTIQSFTWDMGDGSAAKSFPPAVGSGQTRTSTITYSYPTSFTGTAAVTALAVDNHGAAGSKSPAVNFTVQATTLPVVAFVSPAASQSYQIEVGTSNYVSVSYVVQSTPGTGSAFLPVSAIAFNPGDPGALPVSAVSNNDGTYTFIYNYFATAATGTRTVTPAVQATDANGVLGLAVLGSPQTLATVGAQGVPSITISSPLTPANNIYRLQTASMTFIVTDPAADPVTYSVNWGDGSAAVTATLTGSALATGMSVTLTHPYTTASGSPFTATITATDTRSAHNTALAQTRIYTVLANNPPTATIKTPTGSGLTSNLGSTLSFLPLGSDAEFLNPAAAPYPEIVVIPVNGKVNFQGSYTPSTSGEAVTFLWTFGGGVLPDVTVQNPGDVAFPGVPGQVTAYLVQFSVKDPFGRASSLPTDQASAVDTSTFRKWVVVDGNHTENFTLNFFYRLISENNGSGTLALATKTANGNQAAIEIFQDGASSTYLDPAQVNATWTIPVRNDVPFWVNIPSFGSSSATIMGPGIGYMVRIPNVPGVDPALEATGVFVPADGSSFTFGSSTGPDFKPQLDLVTSQGFAAETALPSLRKFQGADTIFLSLTPANKLWIDRLSVPSTDPTPAIPFTVDNSVVNAFSGLTAYQLFAEWPTAIISLGAKDLPSADPTAAPGTSELLGFNLDYAWAIKLGSISKTYAATAMQTFRMPHGVTDPYDLSVSASNWDVPSCVAQLQPTAFAASSSDVLFMQKALFNGNDSASTGSTPLQGGLQGFQVPYDPHDSNRTVAAAPGTRGLSVPFTFSYAEYLWTRAWARPLVLNNALLDSSTDPVHFDYFRYSSPAAWPSFPANPGIPEWDITSGVKTTAAFDLNANGGSNFLADFPVAFGGASPTGQSVGRFFWTAYTPSYSSASGALISRTWLSTATGGFPTTFTTAPGLASTAYGFLPPQDTVVDKRDRDARGLVKASGGLGGYRITWFNPTKEVDAATCVPPDFWVVELSTGGTTRHFLVPASFPAAPASGTDNTQSLSSPILTDARYYIAPGATSDTISATWQSGDLVAPGYCWFDVPVDLRPDPGSSATVTVFAVKSILANNPPALAHPRPLNRTDWIDALKTVTANISVKSSSGTDLGYAHKIPFNYAWDIVVVNGDATIVAP